MKKIRIMLMMFALLLTACSTSSQKEEIKGNRDSIKDKCIG
jgi:starvation-inducible outer membrane lipoprotein